MADKLALFRSAEDMVTWAKQAHSAGKTIALVPTMGNLHRGHLELVARAGEEADLVVVSVFVNPRQFGPGEDFERYPRTLQADREALAPSAVDVVFAPGVEDVYPTDSPVASVSAGPIGRLWEGASRPGHFDGVLTVCSRLFQLTEADVAVFGEKDAQQLFLARQLSASRGGLPKIVSQPTVRDADGLALSSRNSYLSAEQRSLATILPNTLREVSEAIASGMPVERAVEQGRTRLRAVDGVSLDYLDVVGAESFEAERDTAKDLLVIAAVIVGSTRLIDNVRVSPGVRPLPQ